MEYPNLRWPHPNDDDEETVRRDKPGSSAPVEQGLPAPRRPDAALATICLYFRARWRRATDQRRYAS